MAASRTRFELLFALSWIAFGALVLPALVYTVGVVMLGKYVDGGLAAFYGNFYRDLLSGAQAPLALTFGPYVVVMLARVPLLSRKRHRSEADEPATPEQPAAQTRTRVEPRIGG